ncbi:MAG: TonB-dependent receptor, partial [Bacteroidota bacterium]
VVIVIVDNNNNQGNKSNTFYGEYQYQRTFAQLGGLNVVAGVVGQAVNSDSELFGNAEYSTSNFATYVQADRKFFDKLNVSIGIRYERNTINSPDSVANPLEPTTLLPNPETQSIEGKPVLRLGINYQPAAYTFFRASWGQGYRFPTIAERYTLADIGGVIGVRPNPVLQSETGWTGEIGVRQGFKVSNWQGFLDVAAFWSEYQDMMEFTFGGADPDNQFLGFQSVNIDDTRIRGFEASIIGKGKLFGIPTEVLTGYTYIDPQYQTFSERQQELSSSDENILKYRFEHTFKLDIQSQFFGKVDIGVALQYNSFMKAVDRFFEEVQLSPIIPPIDLFGLRDYRERNQNGTAVLNLRFAYNFNENAKLSCLVKNATNQVYMLRPALMEAPINVTIRGDFKF